MGPFAFVVVAFAAYRLTRVVTTDSISEAARDRLYRWAWIEPDEGDAYYVARGLLELKGERVEDDAPVPRQGGLRTYVNELFNCPWCFGVWVSYAAVAFWAWVIRDGIAVAWYIVLGAAVAGVQGFVASRRDA